jgi:hypothetical protein
MRIGNNRIRQRGLEADLATFSRGWLRRSFADFYFCVRVGDSMHDLERAAEQIAIALKRINDVCGH